MCVRCFKKNHSIRKQNFNVIDVRNTTVTLILRVSRPSKLHRRQYLRCQNENLLFSEVLSFRARKFDVISISTRKCKFKINNRRITLSTNDNKIVEIRSRKNFYFNYYINILVKFDRYTPQ